MKLARVHGQEERWLLPFLHRLLTTQRSHGEGRLPCASREGRTRQLPRRQVLRHNRSSLGILADWNDGESQALLSFLHEARIIPMDANAFRSHQRADNLLPPHGEHLQAICCITFASVIWTISMSSRLLPIS